MASFRLPGQGGVGMQSAAAGRHARPKATEINNTNETKEAKRSTKNNGESTRHSTIRITTTTHKHEEDNKQFKAKDHEQNPYPAWNQDSRGRRADGLGR